MSSVVADGNPFEPCDTAVSTSRSGNNVVGSMGPVGTYKERSFEVTDRLEYPHDQTNPAYVLIFNQVEFKVPGKNLRRRDGSDADVDELLTCLNRQGLNVSMREHVVKDATKEQFLQMLEKVRDENISDANALLIIVLSHGKDKNEFYVNDGDMKIEEVTNVFHGLDQTIPKAFIFNACKVNEDQNPPVGKTPRAPLFCLNFVLPPDSVLICSSLENMPSFRDMLRGTWFIQELCNNITAYGHRDDILTLMMRVNKCILKKPWETRDGIVKQLPVTVSNLNRTFYIHRSKDRHMRLSHFQRLKNILYLAESA